MMRIAMAVVVFCLIAVVAGAVHPADDWEMGRRIMEKDCVIGPPDLEGVEIYDLVWFDFDMLDWQGWTREDNTEQKGVFFHVDPCADLACPDLPLEGSQSMWCGTRDGPGDPYPCSWQTAPGYGNDWNQMLTSDPMPFTGAVTISFKGCFDAEPCHDYTCVEYYDAVGGWTELAKYDDDGIVIDSYTIPLAQAATKFRFHFYSDANCSDEDGFYDSGCGGAVIDSITVTDIGGPIDYEDFEGEFAGSTEADGDNNGIYWRAGTGQPYGMYSGLYIILDDKDPLNDNFRTQVVFFIGSPDASDAYPGLYDTPPCTNPGATVPSCGIDVIPCQNEMVVSPVIDLTRYSTNRDEYQDAPIPPAELPDLNGVLMYMETYRDLPLPNLVFYQWYVRSIGGCGCPGPWRSKNFVYYSFQKNYMYSAFDLVQYLDEGCTRIQVALGVVDLCDEFHMDYYESVCGEHTPSPWFDNVAVQRYTFTGPQLHYRSIDLFQDNFPENEFDMESHVRADAAIDIEPISSEVIAPRDYIVVSAGAPFHGGIRYSYFGPDYLPDISLHVKCTYIGCGGPPKPNLFGPSLEGTYGKYESDDGTWTKIRGEPDVSPCGGIIEHQYRFDLNDSLFTRGYLVEYYFEAYDNMGYGSQLPRKAVQNNIFLEFTCLPTYCSDVLFVDDSHQRGTIEGNVQAAWNVAMKAAATAAWDCYDVNGPSSLASNGLGSRAKTEQLINAYDVIVWDAGELHYGTISNGAQGDKSADCNLLTTWMDLSSHDVGLWICGDNVVADIKSGVPPCGFSNPVILVHDSYFQMTQEVNPMVAAPPGSPLYPDSFCVYGGGPCFVHAFDVLDIGDENAGHALEYGECSCEDQVFVPSGTYAGIYSSSSNAQGATVRMLWFGFSFAAIEECDDEVPMVRNRIFAKVMDWFLQPTNPDISGDDTPEVVSYFLEQNYPNPFNPSTTIRFGVKEKGRVTLAIYNVAGQLVRMLVDEVMDAGCHVRDWDGRNDRGGKVASGVYFYRMEANGFEQKRKMVLLR